jgi:hypothetical protein
MFIKVYNLETSGYIFDITVLYYNNESGGYKCQQPGLQLV